MHLASYSCMIPTLYLAHLRLKDGKVFILTFDLSKQGMLCGQFRGPVFHNVAIACINAPLIGAYVRVVNGMGFYGYNLFALCEVLVMGTDSFGKSPFCPRPYYSLKVQSCGLKHHSFIYSFGKHFAQSNI